MPTTLETYADNTLQPSQMPQDARTAAAMFGPSQTIAKGTVLAKKSADGKLYPYDDAVTATSVAVGINAVSLVTDASGNVFYGGSTTPSVQNPPSLSSYIFTNGTFRTADLTGYDAAALADLQGKTLPNGDIQF